jgi:hypothetical protein
LEGEDEIDPETPPLYYYTPGPAPPTPPAASTTAPPSQEDYGSTIASLRAYLAMLRSDFTSFKDLTVVQLDRCFDMIHRIIRDLAPPPPSGWSQDFFYGIFFLCFKILSFIINFIVEEEQKNNFLLSS